MHGRGGKQVRFRGSFNGPVGRQESVTKILISRNDHLYCHTFEKQPCYVTQYFDSHSKYQKSEDNIPRWKLHISDIHFKDFNSVKK